MSVSFDDFNVINDLIRFNRHLSYCLATQRFYNSNLGQRNHSGRDLFYEILSPYSINHSRFKALHGRVVQIQSPDYERTKDVWTRFYQSVVSKDFKSIGKSYNEFKGLLAPSAPQLRKLGDTDLTLVAGEKGFAAPVNVIDESEFPSLHNLYSDFTDILHFDFSPHEEIDRTLFIEQIHRDLRKLLAVPLGRQLISRILASLKAVSKVVILPGEAFTYRRPAPTQEDPDTHQIRYAIRPQFFYQEVPEGLRSLSAPPCIVLAHELLHMLHHLEGTFSHEHNPDLDRDLETDEEERHVIRNLRCCEKHEIDPCNEENLRIQLGFPIRKSHLAGCLPNDPADHIFERSLKVGAHIDAQAAIKRGVSPSVVARMAQTPSPRFEAGEDAGVKRSGEKERGSEGKRARKSVSPT